MKRFATKRRVVRIPVVVEMIPVLHHLAIVLDEVRDTVVLYECIECRLFHHPLKFPQTTEKSSELNIISHRNA